MRLLSTSQPSLWLRNIEKLPALCPEWQHEHTSTQTQLTMPLTYVVNIACMLTSHAHRWTQRLFETHATAALLQQIYFISCSMAIFFNSFPLLKLIIEEVPYSGKLSRVQTFMKTPTNAPEDFHGFYFRVCPARRLIERRCAHQH